MIVGVALFELHVPHAQSLKAKRTVVKSLRDRLRNRFEVSAAEVGLNDLHQRARLGVSIVSKDAKKVQELFDSIVDFIESNGDAQMIGWTQELIEFDTDAALGIAGMKFE